MHLRAEAFWDHSIAYRTHDAHLALALSARLKPAMDTQAIESRMKEIRRKVNRLYVESYEAALELAKAGCDARGASSLIEEASRKCKRLTEALEAIRQELSSKLQREIRLFSPMGAAAASSLVFLMLGCGGSVSGDDQNVVADSGIADASQSDAETKDAQVQDSQSADTQTTDASAQTCKSPNDEQAEQKQLVQALSKEDSCFAGTIRFAPTSGWQADLALDACNTDDNQQKVQQAETEAQKVASEGSYPCLKESGDYVYAQSGVEAESNGLDATLLKACGKYPFDGTVAIVIDATGKVTGVKGASSTQEEQCILQALSGLTFPCLAGYQLCPETVIAE